MRILLIDDDAGLTQLLQLIFESKGIGVSVARGGEQALEALEEDLPEAIVLDWMMPVMNGGQVCSHIRANPRTSHIPIVVLTAKTDEQTRHEAMSAGATEYLIKPIRPSEILNCVRRVANPLIPLASRVLT